MLLKICIASNVICYICILKSPSPEIDSKRFVSRIGLLRNTTYDGALDSRWEGLGLHSQCWPCVEVLNKLYIPWCLGPPAVIGTCMMHRSKVGSKVADCIDADIARGKVKSVEHALSWSLDSKQLPLPLPLPRVIFKFIHFNVSKEMLFLEFQKGKVQLMGA